MSKRLISTFELGPRVAKVYVDPEWCEFIVHFITDGKRNFAATYHTDSKQDALDTATYFIKGEA